MADRSTFGEVRIVSALWPDFPPEAYITQVGTFTAVIPRYAPGYSGCGEKSS